MWDGCLATDLFFFASLIGGGHNALLPPVLAASCHHRSSLLIRVLQLLRKIEYERLNIHTGPSVCSVWHVVVSQLRCMPHNRPRMHVLRAGMVLVFLQNLCMWTVGPTALHFGASSCIGSVHLSLLLLLH